jgi:hypothetical protein
VWKTVQRGCAQKLFTRLAARALVVVAPNETKGVANFPLPLQANSVSLEARIAVRAVARHAADDAS